MVIYQYFTVLVSYQSGIVSYFLGIYCLKTHDTQTLILTDTNFNPIYIYIYIYIECLTLLRKMFGFVTYCVSSCVARHHEGLEIFFS